MPHESGSSRCGFASGLAAVADGPSGQPGPPRIGANTSRLDAPADGGDALEVVEPNCWRVMNECPPCAPFRDACGCRVARSVRCVDQRVEYGIAVPAEVGRLGGRIARRAPELSGAERAGVPVKGDECGVEAMSRKPRGECGVVYGLDIHVGAHTSQFVLHEHGDALAYRSCGRHEQRESERRTVAAT